MHSQKLIKASVVLLTLAVFQVVHAAPITLDSASFGGSTYYLIGGGSGGTGINFTDAESYAQSNFGAHLVTINSAAEHNFLASQWGTYRATETTNPGYALWIGLQRNLTNNLFDTWNDGTPVSYINYNPGEPNEQQENWIAMWITWDPGCGQSGVGNKWFNTLNDSGNSCDLNRQYYGIVETTNSVPEPSALLLLSIGLLGLGLSRKRKSS